MTNKKSILIVDEDRQRVGKLTKQCRQIGLQVRTAYSVLMAMTELDEGLPDLVCLDIDMPSSNGLSVCEMMATDEEATRVPIIALSTTKNETIIRRCANLCAYHVHKSQDTWYRIEPVIYELVDIDPPVSDSLANEPV